ncbi:MAG: hypothetical protein J3K34DRAFT_486900, partial [Monoraphidium minutum]
PGVSKRVDIKALYYIDDAADTGSARSLVAQLAQHAGLLGSNSTALMEMPMVPMGGLQQQADAAAAARAHALQLQERLQALLRDPSPAAPPPHAPRVSPPGAAAADELRALLAAHDAAALLGGGGSGGGAAARGALLALLTSQLGSAAAALRGALDAAYALRKLPAPAVPPEDVVAYAHRLRYGFFPLGTTPDLGREPPAPQVPNMVASSLAQLAAQHKAAGAARGRAAEEAAAGGGAGGGGGALPSIPAGWKPGDPIPDEFLLSQAPLPGPGAAAGGGGGGGAPAPAAAAAPAPAAAAAAAAPGGGILGGLMLNQDLGLGEEVDYSEDDWSDE